MRRFIAAAIATLVPTTALAGGWTQPEGDGYFKAWNRTLIASGMFTHDGGYLALPEDYVEHGFNLYGEYGLTDRTTLVAFGNPIGYASYGDETTLYTGLLAAGARHGWQLGELRLAAEGHYGLTPSADALGGGTVDDEVFVVAPTVGHHRLDAEVQAGHPWRRGWMVAQGGYRWQSDDLLAVTYGFAQLGWQTTRALQLDLHFAVNEPLGDVATTNVTGAGDTRYGGWGLGVSYAVASTWSIVGSFEGVFYAESNAATPSLGIGVAHHLRR